MASKSQRKAPTDSNGDDKPWKRLIVCCDGTWQQADSPYQPKEATAAGYVPESNVVRLCRSLRKAADVVKNGKTYHIPQVVFYQNGIGTNALSSIDPYISGAVGGGLNGNVTEAYFYIANNWEEGDEIFLFGFSRGAYTARALSGLISNIGILGRRELHKFQQIYEKYMGRHADLNQWEKGLGEFQRKAKDVKIKVVGVFDTVGSVGIPDSFITEKFGLNARHQFHDTELSSRIENAFHALALDERRHHFGPTMWYLRNDHKQQQDRPNLKQCWFPGYHIDVGGGSTNDPNNHNDFSDISFAWMVDQCSPFLTFHDCVDKELIDANHAEPRKKGDGLTYGARMLHDSNTDIYRVARKTVRKPGQYKFPDRSVKSGQTFLANVDTKETIHPSARIRILKSDVLVADKDQKAPWLPQSLAGFQLEHCAKRKGQPAEWRWVKEEKDLKTEEITMVTIYEEDIGLGADEKSIAGGKGSRFSYSREMMLEADKQLLRNMKKSPTTPIPKHEETWAEYFLSFVRY